MNKHRGQYSVIQFSPRPERFEYVNIGVLLVVEETDYAQVKMSKNNRRVEKLFGAQQGSYLDTLKFSFEERLMFELSRGLSDGGLKHFSEARANQMRLTKLLPIAVDQPEEELERLFRELVGEEARAQRQPKVTTLLKNCFAKAGVSHYVERPKPVTLPDHGITISAPFGYQNGSYNLISPIRLGGEPGDALREAGKSALEGRLLASSEDETGVRRRLIVVADLAEQKPSFIETVEEIMDEHEVRFFNFRHIDPLIKDIRYNGERHSQ